MSRCIFAVWALGCLSRSLSLALFLSISVVLSFIHTDQIVGCNDFAGISLFVSVFMAACVCVCLASLRFIPLHLVRLVHWLTLWFDLFATQCFNEFRARLLPIEYTFEPNRGMHFVGIKSHAKPVPTCSSYMIHFFLPNMLNTHSIYLRLKFLTTMFFCAPVNVTFHLTSSISANNALFLGIPLKLALLTLFLCLSLYLSVSWCSYVYPSRIRTHLAL